MAIENTIAAATTTAGKSATAAPDESDNLWSKILSDAAKVTEQLDSRTLVILGE